MDRQEQEVLKIVKLRLNLSDDLDTLINSYIREIGRRIRHFCNITKIPDDLTDVWASMVMDAVRVELPNVEEISDSIGDDAGTVKIGDTSVGGGSSSSGGMTTLKKTVIDEVVLNYKVDLIHYRRLRW
nr:DNA-packaging protein [Aneurinibacillus sp. XH2]